MGGDDSREKIEEFVLKLIEEKGIELDGDRLAEEKDRLVDKLEDEISRAMVLALPDEKADELEKMIDEKGDDLEEAEVIRVIEGSQSEVNKAIEEAMVSFRENYLRGDD